MLGAGRLPCASCLTGLFGALPQPDRCVCRARPNRGGDPGLPGPTFAASRLAFPSRKLGDGCRFEGFGSFEDGAGPLFAGTQGEPGLGLVRPGRAGSSLELVAEAGVGLGVDRRLLGRGCQTLSQVVVGRSVGVEGDHRGRDGSLDALALALGSPNDRAQVSQLLAHRAHPGVGFVQPLQSGLGALGRHSDLVANPSQPEPGLLDERRRGGDS